MVVKHHSREGFEGRMEKRVTITFSAQERDVLARAAAVLEGLRERLPRDCEGNPAYSETEDMDAGIAADFMSELSRRGKLEADDE
jgi:hypothetical protein